MGNNLQIIFKVCESWRYRTSDLERDEAGNIKYRDVVDPFDKVITSEPIPKEGAVQCIHFYHTGAYKFRFEGQQYGQFTTIDLHPVGEALMPYELPLDTKADITRILMDCYRDTLKELNVKSSA